MAPDLIFDEIRGAIKAGIGFMRLGVGLQRDAGHQMQGTIRPESRPFRFDRYMAGGRSSPVFRKGRIDSRLYVRAKSFADVQILARDAQSHCPFSVTGAARHSGWRNLSPRP
jgi:hypothetical protein